MQELFARLKKAIAEHGPNSPDVQAAVGEIEARFAKQAWRARAMVEGEVVAGGGEPPPGEPPAGPATRPVLPLIGGLVAGGGIGAGVVSVSWQDLQRLPLPPVTSPWALLLVVAVVGVVVALGHTYYRNGWTLILPTWSRGPGRFRIESFGFLRNMVFGAAVAVATTWMAFSPAAIPPPGQSAEPRPDEPGARPTLLTWNVLVSAVLAGIFGSMVASGEVEVKSLWQALARVAEVPGVPGLKKLVENARTPFEAVTVATGDPPPGYRPPRGDRPSVRETEAELLKQFHRTALAAAVAGMPKPVDRTGAGLKLATLEAFDPLKPAVQNLLKDFEVSEVAAGSLDEFAGKAEDRGLDAAHFRELLANLHRQSVRVMELLGSLPKDWTLDPGPI
jgi:hypothetical protein